jgi:N-sulfoglucosamine sulfohydrolase
VIPVSNPDSIIVNKSMWNSFAGMEMNMTNGKVHTMTKKVLGTLALIIVCQATLLSSHAYAKEGKPINVLLFLTDDESALERSLYGWSNLPTPNMDRIANNGVLFRHGYSSAPSCGPARAAILSGRNFWENETGGVIQGFLPNKFPVFTQLLAKNNYLIGNTGKRDGPASRPEQGHKADDLTGKPYRSRTIPDAPPEVRPIDYAGNFQEFLKDREPGQPFFFWAGVIEPHIPVGPDNYKLLEEQFGVSLDEVAMPPRMKDTLANRKERGSFVYEICWADQHLGRMIAYLEEIGELENTLIIATSDNGTALLVDGQHYGKASPYDYGVNIPLAMMWPDRIKAGREVTDFVSFADFAPTILELAGIEVPASMTGRSLVQILESEESGRIDPTRNFMRTGMEWHGEFDPEARTFRTYRDDKYAYIERYANVDEAGVPLSNEELIKPTSVEFYDMENDPWQLTDLADDPAYADELKRMARLFHEHGMQVKDPRVTGDMDIFKLTRQYVQKRKRTGYGKTLYMPFPDQ